MSKDQVPALSRAFKLDYKASPVAAAFHNSKAFVRGIRGPIGSGKSVACCLEIFIRAKQQHPSIDGIRRTRWAVVRNTGPELETTTIKTWLDWFPESIFGKLNRKPPITHKFCIEDIEMEIIFLALDRPDDVKKLLSLEVTGVFFNEARFIHKDIVDGATGRVGRYPAKKEKPEGVPDDQWPTWYGVIMDTNPPDDDHWWYQAAETDQTPEGWEFFAQPSGLAVNAENIENLPRGYYQRIVAGKTKEWTNVFVHGKYGTIQDGKPVYGSAYRDEVHCVTDLKAIPMLMLHVGLDFGNTPAAIIEQCSPTGQWRALEEMVGNDIALVDFAKLLKQKLAIDYVNHEVTFYGDPSGSFKDQHQKTAFDIFRSVGIIVRPAPSNKIKVRTEGVVSRLNRMINGQPGFIIDAKKCPTLRKGFNGGYRYKRLQVAGTDRYMEDPEKNQYSHVHDAHQYVTLSTGEYQNITRAKQTTPARTVFNKNKWSIWDQ
jgi:hypothetical protein